MAHSCDKRPHGQHKPMSRSLRAKCGRDYAMRHAVEAHDRRYHSGDNDEGVQ